MWSDKAHAVPSEADDGDEKVDKDVVAQDEEEAKEGHRRRHGTRVEAAGGGGVALG